MFLISVLNGRMKSLKFTKQTGQVALVFFTLYFVYGLFYTPFVQYLVSLAVGGIAYGITDSAEIAVILLLVVNYLFSAVVGKKEGFVDVPSNIRESLDKAKEKEMEEEAESELNGVGSAMSEGFEDAEETDMSISETKKPKKEEASVAKSKPADASMGEAVNPKDMEKMAGMMKKMVESMGNDVLASPPAKKISEDNVPPAHQPQEKETFQDNSGLFKLGQIPKDEKGGHHIDAGTTVMNAINALKPDQIKAMTTDTKQLIETQKSLMGMLQAFQPMVSEGKQMMDTFQEMFSPAMGASKPGAK
jgi:hypothetical protein